MILAKIDGVVVAPQKNEHLANNRLLIAQPIDLKGNPIGTSMIALDRVDAGEGDIVLVMKEGGSARIIFQNQKIPLQCVVVAVIDNIDVAPQFLT
ncbi:MAG TPA: EutN/CcmL family microcompartment protein [Planctomycetota bacterium]|jgi:ethanolamine utilization protein EutN|nr:EutN/CcmL family microcompartment protein [Planctomycetota bacterium]HQB00784.1 EutN/CcmL family microcompartment protein [Planctomycetota bacterium]HRU51982.1 EutN/CcmL family microcompartment protein [Planctomycetota bacterium]